MKRARTDSRANPAPRPTRPVIEALLVAAAVLTCSGYALAELYFLGAVDGLPLDDSWIHLQFARNLAGGDGLSYNAGELVAGSTAPLWTALLSLPMLIWSVPIVPIKLLGAALHGASIHAVLRLGREIGLSRGGALLAAVFTLSSGWLVWSALSGLEIPLFVLLSLWGVVLHLRERRRGGAPRSLAVLAAAVLARPEGLLLLLLALADRLLLFERRADGVLALRLPPLAPLAWGAAVAAVVVLPVALFHLGVGGSVLPTTFTAKGGGSGGWVPQAGYLYRILGIFFRSQPVLVLLVGGGAAALVARMGGDRDRGLLPAVWLLALPLAMSVLSPESGNALLGNFGRYFFPLFPFLAVVGVLGLEEAGRAMGPRLRAGPLRLPWRAVAVALILAPTVPDLGRAAGRYVQSIGNVRNGDVAIARWLAEHLPDDAVLAVNDVGAIKFLLPRHRVLDLAGILHPEVVRYRLEALASGRPAVAGDLRFLEENRPDYLVVFPRWFPGLMTESSGYRLLYAREIPDNIALGDDRIVVMSTPWTRGQPSAEPGSGAARP